MRQINLEYFLKHNVDLQIEKKKSKSERENC